MSILDRIVKRHGPQQADKSNPELVIVQMQRRDIREIMPIENAVYPKPWTEKVFQDEIEMMHRNQRLYLVARVGRELVGYCGLLFSNDDAHITNIAVSPRWQNCGVATELMLENPTLVKRPVLEAGDRIVVGFSEPIYRNLFPGREASAA